MTYKKHHEKSRTIAIILAVLFGMFSWLYTWKYDSWKFWTALAMWIFSIILGISLITGIVIFVVVIADQSFKSDSWFKNY